jgi:Na+-transporting methylmalonyl-CoA/oxaloacetate decarboxylase gamma subunit
MVLSFFLCLLVLVVGYYFVLAMFLLLAGAISQAISSVFDEAFPGARDHPKSNDDSYTSDNYPKHYNDDYNSDDETGLGPMLRQLFK